MLQRCRRRRRRTEDDAPQSPGQVDGSNPSESATANAGDRVAVLFGRCDHPLNERAVGGILVLDRVCLHASKARALHHGLNKREPTRVRSCMANIGTAKIESGARVWFDLLLLQQNMHRYGIVTNLLMLPSTIALLLPSAASNHGRYRPGTRFR